MSCLLNNIMKSVISYKIAKATWTNLVHNFEGPSDTKENKFMDLKLEYQTFRDKHTESLSQTYTFYKTLLNELANDGGNLSKHEINVGFVNSLHKKWLTFSYRLRNANHTPTLDLVNIYGSQADPKIQKDYKAEYKKMKAKPALLEANPSTSHNRKTFQPKNKGLVAKTFNWDEEEVLDNEEVTQVKVLMALADDELTVGKNHACNGEWIDITMRRRHIKGPIWYLDSGCSRSMTSFKSYPHKYVEQPGPKVVFSDNSSCITEGYGSINCGGILFPKVAFVNGLKYNLLSISQLYDAKYIVQFDDKQGTIFNANKEIVLIAPRRNDVYDLDMSLLTPNGACFFTKASESIN
ncbi:hypothetical protein Tco_0640476 [Tanacetum coccineum]